MLKENEAVLKNRSDVVIKEQGTIEFSLLLSFLFFSRFSSTLTWIEGTPDYAVLVLREAACEVICRKLCQHFCPGLQVVITFGVFRMRMLA